MQTEPALTISHEPDKRPTPWGPVAAIVGTIALFLLGQILGSVLAGIVISSCRALNLELENGTSAVQFITTSCIYGVIALGLYGVLRGRKASWKTLGLGSIKLKYLAYALAGFGAYFMLYLLISVAVRALVPSLDFNQRQEIGFNQYARGLSLILTFFALVVWPPIVEELLFRGFLWTGLRSKLPAIGGAIVTSALFAAPHLQFGTGNPLLWVAALDTFVLSLVLIYVRVSSRSLWSAIFLHAIKNGMAFVLLFVFKVS